LLAQLRKFSRAKWTIRSIIIRLELTIKSREIKERVILAILAEINEIRANDRRTKRRNGSRIIKNERARRRQLYLIRILY